jgi:hypothetical protein
MIFPGSITSSYLIPSSKSLKMNAGEDLLFDKIYRFLEPYDTLLFENTLPLEKNYNYYISVKIVSPHTCSMEINLWDPEGTQYNIFYKENMTQEGDFEIPFGIALKGNYSIKFSVHCNRTLNIHLAMKKGGKCLQDIISIQEWEEKVLYNVIKFNNNTKGKEHIYFKTDTYYKFYIGRVSAIASNISNIISLDYIIEDPDNVSFIIYFKDTLEIISHVNIFKFGTAIEGVYVLDISIYSEVQHVNIAYAVIKGNRISEILDPNATEPDPTNITDSRHGIFFLSPLVVTSTIIVVLIILGISIIAIIIHRRRNPIALNLKKFNPKK